MTLPTPYYDSDGITVYHADCRDILPHIEPGSVDLVLTDPPYGIALESHGLRFLDAGTIVGDGDAEVGQWLVDWSASQKLPTVVFASPMKAWRGDWRQWLVWDKGEAVGGGGDIGTCWKQSWELIQVARTGELNGKRDGAVLKYWMNPADSTIHPAAKSLPLLRYLVGKVQAEIILDPFMGSGTTLRAALDLGRKAIGIELEERYCEIAANRLRQMVLPMAAD